MFDDWILVDNIFKEREIPNAFGYQSSTNEEQNLTVANGGRSLSFEGMLESPHAINPPRKRSHTDYKGFGCDM